MAVAVILPKLDEAMASGKITKWLKKEGDRMEKGAPLFEVETEKVNFEVDRTPGTSKAGWIIQQIDESTSRQIEHSTSSQFSLRPHNYFLQSLECMCLFSILKYQYQTYFFLL